MRLLLESEVYPWERKPVFDGMALCAGQTGHILTARTLTTEGLDAARRLENITANCSKKNSSKDIWGSPELQDTPAGLRENLWLGADDCGQALAGISGKLRRVRFECPFLGSQPL